eukprot:91437_1
MISIKTLKEEISIILLKKFQYVNFKLGHMIDWDHLFDLQKNKQQDFPKYNQISWDWHCGTSVHGFTILFINKIKKMNKKIPMKNASHSCGQIMLSLSLKGERAKKC